MVDVIHDTPALIVATDTLRSTVIDENPPTPGIPSLNYSKANIRQSNSVSMNSMNRPYTSRTRQRAVSLADAHLAPETTSSHVPSESPTHTIPPKPRKRLSMNFALPVFASTSQGSSPNTSSAPRRAGYHAPSASMSVQPISAASSHNHSKTQSFSHSMNSPTVRQSPAVSHPPAQSSTPMKHRQAASVSFITSPTNRAHNPRSKNLSNDSNGSFSSTSTTTNSNINNSTPSISSSPTSSIEYYFSQLAYRERRVVELRDEIKRMQLQLRQAEDDLAEFRNHVPTDLMPQTMTPTSTPERPSNAATTLSRSHTISGTSSTSSHVNTPNKVSDESKARRLSHIHSPFTIMDSVVKTEEPKKHRLVTSSSSISSAGSSILSSSNKATRHSNSLSDSSNSSVEAVHEVKSTLAGPPSRSHHAQNFHSYSQQASFNPLDHSEQSVLSDAAGDDMFHKGRRVVEELGTQFWSFFEDIKNVTVGEEARDTTYAPPQRPQPSVHQQQQQQPRSNGMQMPPRKPRRRLEEPCPEVVVTGVASSSSVQRRASTGMGMRGSVSMSNLNHHLPGSKTEVGDKKLQRNAPEASFNSYYIV